MQPDTLVSGLRFCLDTLIPVEPPLCFLEQLKLLWVVCGRFERVYMEISASIFGATKTMSIMLNLMTFLQ